MSAHDPVEVPTGAAPRFGVVLTATLAAAAPHVSVRLSEGHVQLISVLAEVPAGRAGADRDRVAARCREEEAAGRLLGVQHIRMAAPSAAAAADLPALLQRLGRHLAGAQEVWLPMALQADPGQQLAREVGQAAVRELPGEVPVVVYPSGVRKLAEDRLEALCAEVAEGFGASWARLRRTELNAEAATAKAAVLSCFSAAEKAAAADPDMEFCWVLED